MDFWSALDSTADLALIYGVRQRADALASTRELLVAQRSALAIERQRLALEASRQQEDADERRRQQTLDEFSRTRKLLCKFEQNLELFERPFDPLPEDIVTLAIIEENAKRLENVFRS